MQTDPHATARAILYPVAEPLTATGVQVATTGPTHAAAKSEYGENRKARRSQAGDDRRTLKTIRNLTAAARRMG